MHCILCMYGALNGFGCMVSAFFMIGILHNNMHLAAFTNK